MKAPDVRTCCPTMKGQHHTCGLRQTRGSTNRNTRGSSTTRRIRREWLVETFKADVARLVVRQASPHGIGLPEIGGLLHDEANGFVREHDEHATLPSFHKEGDTVPAWQVWSQELPWANVPSVLAAYQQPHPNMVRQGVTIAAVFVVPVCRCYRCGKTLDDTEVSPDKIHLQADGGGYARHNIRPCCADCQSFTGGMAGVARKAAKTRRRK